MAPEPDADIVELFETLGIPASDIPADLARQIELASDRVFARDDRYSVRDLAERFERDAEEVCSLLAEIGVRVYDLDEILFNDRDVDLMGFIMTATDHVLVEGEGDELLNVIGAAVETIAEAGVANHVQGPERRLQTDTDGVHLNKAMAELGLALGDILPMVFRHHLRQGALRQRRTQNKEHRELVELSVGFVDLVGFTALSQTMGSLELVGFVREFERAAHEAARRHGARIAKLIGDEVMFIAESPTDAVAFATELIDAFRTDGVVPRGGVACGSLITLHGDYFGPIVNLAARLVDHAVPGEVLVTGGVAADVGDRAVSAGRRVLKGFDEPQAVWSISAG
ncbi:MAG: adenylate/guanylate cyclase domain-containing protein [Actinomycetota bacterium]